MSDFLFRGTLADLDYDVQHLIDLESERQVRKLILIPSESTAPLAVREALSSSFQNIYAEGYPD
ncbi:MAG: serine hydroxymethyltransferase, partial [Chloroflexi bacterium]|nr:serine hydroxymethyltransferase [Chloroflexota bacterium]